MALPDANAAKTWGGKLLVDRDGTEIGTCTQIFVDDATGLPEWAAADLNGGPALVPLVDAAESGDRVRVAVRQVDVADAPPVGDAWHISVEEEERLYRHYGIDVSHAASESLLPVDEPVAPEPSSPAPPSAEFEPEPEPTTDATGHHGRAPLLRGLAAVVVGAVAAVGATVFWWRHRQAPPTRAELLAARARAASLALGTRRAQVSTMTAPLLQAGRKLSETAAQRARAQARTASERAAAQSRAAAERAAAQSRAAAERAMVQSRAAAQQAAALAAVARTVRLQRVPAAADVQPVPPAAGADRLRRLVDVLEAGAGFAAGYALGARGEGRRFDRLTRTPTNWARSPQVQQAMGRVRVRATDTWQAGSAQVSRRAGGVTERVRRRSDRSGEAPLGSEDSTPAS